MKKASGVGFPLLLALVTFLVYWPSLYSDFVYDARLEIFKEGFITSFSNIFDVLTLKVLGMNLILADRPGQLFYLMMIATVSGREPFGYHLCSNLLHAANVALLFILLRRLIAKETDLTGSAAVKAQLAAGVAVMIFALHPIGVESVAEVSYSSNLLVTFFTLLALLAATVFRPEDFRSAIQVGAAGALCALAAVMCKESGLAASALLIVYWFLFRRGEARRPWALFLVSAVSLSILFLLLRFHMALPTRVQFEYLGGSFGQVFFIQPTLWTFMMGKLIWPLHLSADYTPENSAGISTRHAMGVVGVVILIQWWLASRSRIGAFGVVVFWLGLATVSNFVPLYHALADRYYYLPMAGVAIQLFALMMMAANSRGGFRAAVAALLVAMLPLTSLTLSRQKVFANEASLWSDTVQVSPFSSIAHTNLGLALFEMGKWREAIANYQRALEITPGYAEAYNDMGVAFYQMGKWGEAMDNFQKALQLDPTLVEAHNNVGLILFHQGKVDEAMAQYKRAIEIMPNYADAHHNLVIVYLKKGDTVDAIEELKEALRLNPKDDAARKNLARAQAMMSQGVSSP